MADEAYGGSVKMADDAYGGPANYLAAASQASSYQASALTTYPNFPLTDKSSFNVIH